MNPQGLTAITIENFKGIGQAVTIPLRPVTLLFGANSAGKSTIIQALQYAWEILENRNADVDRTRLGGEVIDLGGFQNLVHGHDLSRSISITLHYAGGLKDDAYRAPEKYHSFLQERLLDQWEDDTLANVSDWLDITSFAVTLGTSWENNVGAYISKYEVSLDGAWFGRFISKHRSTPLIEVNCRHPILSEEAFVTYHEYARKVMADIKHTFSHSVQSRLEEHLASSEFVSETDLRDLWKKIESEVAVDPNAVHHCVSSVIPEWGSRLWISYKGDWINGSWGTAEDESAWVLEQVLFGAGEAILHELRQFRYLGPLRSVPERNFTSPRHLDKARWAKGLAAWDALLREGSGGTEDSYIPNHYNDNSNELVGTSPADALLLSRQEKPEDPNLIERCNYYLNEVLGLGYTVRRDSRIQLPEDSAILSELRLFAAQYDERDGADLLRRVLEPLERLPRVAALQLHDEKRDIDIDPMDIGVGVSQTLPVVVGAVEPNCTIFAVEQPELHIHPAVQSRMGDLFLRECLGTPGRIFLLETHSEHLMLRMLRRIRETADGELPPGYPRVTPEDVQVLYVESEGGVTSIVPLPITEDGDFAQKWPHGFFTEREEDLF